MKFRKAQIADVLWGIAILTVFMVVIQTQLEFSNVATIDAYAKNIVNTEATRFVSSIAGYSKSRASCNMYNSRGDKRDYGSTSDIASSLKDDTASATGIFNKAKDIMIRNIQEEFANNVNLSTRTTGIDASNVSISLSEPTGKSTIVTVTVTYNVTGKHYKGKDGGYVEKTDMSVQRKVVVTRTIENPMRFK